MSLRCCVLLLLPALALACQTAPPRADFDTRASEVLGDVVVRISGHAAEEIDANEPAAQSLSLEDALRRAVLHDPRLQAALAHVRLAEADAGQARLLPNPILSVAVRFRTSEDPIIDASLAADLISLLLRPHKISAADNRLRAAAAAALTGLADVAFDVQESYLTVQALTDALAALDERRKLAERLVELARARRAAGEGTSLDVIALETLRMVQIVDTSEKRQDLAAARLALARLIGEPSSAADWRLAPCTPPAPARAKESAWIAAAMRHRSELRAKEWELAALGDDAALARLAIWEGGDAGVQSERDVEWSVGPSLTTPVPLFDWGQAKRAKAAAELAVARHQMTLLRRQIVQDVRTQYLIYNASLQTLGMARNDLLPLQERRSAQAQASYKAGETDIANLLLAEEDLLDARIKVTELQKKTALARIKLQRAVGGTGVAKAVESSATRPATTSPSTTRAAAATQEGRP